MTNNSSLALLTEAKGHVCYTIQPSVIQFSENAHSNALIDELLKPKICSDFFINLPCSILSFTSKYRSRIASSQGMNYICIYKILFVPKATQMSARGLLALTQRTHQQAIGVGLFVLQIIIPCSSACNTCTTLISATSWLQSGITETTD